MGRTGDVSGCVYAWYAGELGGIRPDNRAEWSVVERAAEPFGDRTVELRARREKQRIDRCLAAVSDDLSSGSAELTSLLYSISAVPFGSRADQSVSHHGSRLSRPSRSEHAVMNLPHHPGHVVVSCPRRVRKTS